MGDDSKLMKLFVGGLNEDTTEETVRAYFKSFCEGSEADVSSVSLAKTPEGKSRKFCFVEFSNGSDIIDNIVFNFESHSIDNKQVEVKRAMPRDDPNELAHVRTKKLFIGGLKDEHSEEDVKTALAPLSPFAPLEIKMVRDRETNKFKGYCFVNFPNEHIVDKLYLVRHIQVKGKDVEMKKAADLGAGGRGGRGGRGGGRGAPRGRGGPRGGGGGSGGYGGGSYGGYGNYGGYSQGGYGGYADNSWSGGYGSYDGGYGNGGDYSNGYSSYGGGYGGGYDSSMGQYSQEASGYGPSRGTGGRGRGAPRGSGGYRPY